MIKAIYVKNTESAIEKDIDKLPEILTEKPRIIWVDITIENNELSSEQIAVLAHLFKFDDLSIEDCLFPQYHPKIEEFENYVFAAIHGIKAKVRDLEDFENAIYELDLFIGKGFIVTVHTGELLIVENLFEKAKIKPQVELRSIENLLYNIFQKVVASFELNMEKINDRFDELEDKVLENPSAELIPEIFSLKKILLYLRKITEPQQNVYTYFTREATGFISSKHTAYFRDVFFQIDRINQSISAHTQLIGSILEVYVSGVTLKLNEIMKFLTIIATVLLPAVLIVSYYGMNVVFPEYELLGRENLWYFVAALIVLSTAGVFYYIKRKKWF